ncbi:hypothetical protein O181_037641 [Austropuccinia psidii MF-1]|uniref:Reverse transcriptase Ty1/copia-type domain-containing protein n=1 Tax=Austropuccinia psidii MF-1 TaxID=1389203 RepID=A0A9Q3D6L1_9BASI|nr:hypothetical protein [Austropuccinia psidii MF-1]
MELDAVGIVVPNELLSYSLLGKLGKNSHLSQFVESLIFNEDIIEKPLAILSRLQDFASNSNLSNHTDNKKETSSSELVTTYDEPHKIIFYCSQGKHNIRCTTHKKEEFWAENPHLRPSHREKKCKNNPSAHLSIAQALTTIGGDLTPDRNQVVIDCDATHHMFNSPTFFCKPPVAFKSKVATGDAQSHLLTIGLELFKIQLTIQKTNNSFSLISKGQVLLEGKIINRLMYLTYDSPTTLLTTLNGDLNVTFNEKVFPLVPGGVKFSWNFGEELPDGQCSNANCPLDIDNPADRCSPTDLTTPQETKDWNSDGSNPPRLSSPVESCANHDVLPPNVTTHCPNIIGPRHPTLITSDINPTHILPYPRREKTFLTSSDYTPRTDRLALQCKDRDKWTAAIAKELSAMNDLNIWDIIELKDDYKLVGTTWVFKMKKDHLKQTIEYKARLCAQGFTQTPGIDFDKTYAPTGRLNLLRALVAHACTNNLEFHQIDVKSAFLNAPLSEKVYLSVPQGLTINRQKYCLRLKKAIYGLKQAPLAWYNRLKSWLQSVGFSACKLDPCVFHRNQPDALWIYIHVDNMALFGRNTQPFKEQISREFSIKDSGPADLLLGVKIHQLKEGIMLNQQHFVEAFLDAYGMQNCKAVSTPLIPNEHLSAATEAEKKAFSEMKVNYRSAVGSINYLSSATRPDLSHAVSSLSQHLEQPGVQHWKAFLHVLKYLSGTQEIGLYYKRQTTPSLVAFSDADWGNCQTTRCSTSGFLALLHGCLVFWKTRKQPLVSISTAEAEYKSLCDLTSELLWFQQWCQEADIYKCTTAITVWEDNQSCINTTNGNCNVSTKRMKHVDIQLHFFKEAIQNKLIELCYSPTTDMLADFLTKSVPKVTLDRALRSLGVLRLGLRGDVEKQAAKS